MQNGSVGRGNTLDVADLPRDAACFLQADETVFLTLRGRSEEVSLVGPPEEVFGRAEVKCRRLRVRPIDFLGHACLHCTVKTSELKDFMLCVRTEQVVAAFHETCFKRWFVLQDKATFGSYRFAYLDRTRSLRGQDLKIIHPDSPEPRQEIPITPIQDLEYTELADSGLEAEAAYVRKQGGQQASPEVAESGAPTDSNILFCPHCDYPNRVPFLETEGAHHCGRCSGRFGVKIVPL